MLKDVRLIYFEPLDGDVTAAEIWDADRAIVAELLWRRDGSRAVYLHPTQGIEVDGAIFIEMMQEAAQHLEKRVDELRRPGEEWSEAE